MLLLCFQIFQINFAFWSLSFSPFFMIFCAMCRKYNLTIDALTVISYNADKAYSFYESGIKDCIFILSYMHLPVGQKASLLIFRKSMLYHFTVTSASFLSWSINCTVAASRVLPADYPRFLLCEQKPSENPKAIRQSNIWTSINILKSPCLLLWNKVKW